MSESEGFSDKTDYLCDTTLRSPPVETNQDDTEEESIKTGKEEEIPLLKDNPKPENASYKDDSSADVTLDKNSVDSQVVYSRETSDIR